MTDEDRQSLEDILEFAERAVRIAAGLPPACLVADEEKYYSVRYCLQVIGQCVTELHAEVTDEMSSIPWPEIRGMRHRLVHGYSNFG